MTTEQLKRLSERRHRWVQRYLQHHLPNCIVTYNGVEGVDHIISYYKGIKGAEDELPKLISETIIETKTCQGIISGGINYELTKPDRPYTFTIPRLGRFKFDLRPAKPYDISQHEDLVRNNGWYVFVIGDWGKNIITGIRADQLNLRGNTIKKLSWGTILKQCYPDWLTRLKHQIYCTNENQKEKEHKQMNDSEKGDEKK